MNKTTKPILAFAMVLSLMTIFFPASVFAASPTISGISSLPGEFSHDPDVRMDGYRVSAKRYLVNIDGISYEAYCCDPLLRGPESAGAVYELRGEANSKLKNALKNGYPINSEWSSASVDVDERMYWAYVTRVATAMANNTTRSFTGDSVVTEQAKNLANGEITADASAYPGIMINGAKDSQDTGRTIKGSSAQSKPFEITYNRKTNDVFTPFTFKWAAGTPSGAKLIVDGAVIATAPENSDKIFRNDITSFTIEMPNTTEFKGKKAAVTLEGIHNQYADKIWLMQNPDEPDRWQDIVFYIPEVSASAAFSFETEQDEPDPNPTIVKIQKIDALTRENIPGALIRLRGISSSQVITEDGQIREIDNTGINLSQVLTEGATIGGGDVKSTVTDGVWELEGLPYGAYVAEEERAPENYSLLPQHTSYSFWLLPGNVTIKLNQDESTVYVDDVQVSVHEALNAAIAGIKNYDDAKALASELQGIIDKLLSQLKVDAVFTVEVDQSTNSQLITFENYPFGKIEVTKYDAATGETLADAHFRIQGYFAEGNTNGMPIDRVAVTGSDGKVTFDNLPAGQYTISEVQAPPGYELDKTEFRSISLTWGQTESTTFYNKPKTFVEVIKVDGNDSSKLLDGAIFRLKDPTTGEIWEGTTSGGKVRLGVGNGSFGNQLVKGKLYILTEVEAPKGYVLNPSPIEVIVSADNQLNIVNVLNFKKPTLTIRKYDELTNKPLAGASFRLWKTEGETWSETMVTDANGVITWTDLDPGIYSIQETDEPYGYFKDTNRKEILLKGGDNKELEFFNRPRPILTILKRDKVTGEPLTGVKFKVQRLEGETIGEFTTDAKGMIELSPKTGYLLDEKIYRVTEITPPVNYLLSDNLSVDVLLKWHEPTELIFENILKPTLIFIKRDGMSGYGISGATYRVQYESPTGGVTTLGSYVTKCGLIVLPHVEPGWYVLTETSPAPGYSLPTNPTQRFYLAPGENSYNYSQTKTDLYVDPRTNPNSGKMGDCGDWCGYLCSVLCGDNCGNPGGGSMEGNKGGSFGNITITNGKGEPISGGTTQPKNTPTPTPTPIPTPTPTPKPTPSPSPEPPNFDNIVITGGTVVYLNPDFSTVTIKFGNY